MRRDFIGILLILILIISSMALKGYKDEQNSNLQKVKLNEIVRPLF